MFVLGVAPVPAVTAQGAEYHSCVECYAALGQREVEEF